MAKTIGITHHQEDEAEIRSVSEIKPRQDKKESYVAKSDDYVVVMHYDEALRDTMIGQLTEDKMYFGLQEVKRNKSKSSAFQNFAFPKNFEKTAKSNMTFKEKKKDANRIDTSIFQR